MAKHLIRALRVPFLSPRLPCPPLGVVVSSVQTGCITYTQAHAIAVERVALGCLDETYKNIRPSPKHPSEQLAPMGVAGWGE